MINILMYNIKPEKMRSLQVILLRLGMHGRVVLVEEQNKTLAELLELTEVSAHPPCDVPFSEEMLVLYNLPKGKLSQFLDASRESKASVPLKAMVTETNVSWTGTQLNQELKAEQEAMKKQLAFIHSRKDAAK